MCLTDALRVCLTVCLTDAQVCTKCKIEKDSSQFHRNTLTASGLVSRCKQCIAEADARRCVHLATLICTAEFQHRLNPRVPTRLAKVSCTGYACGHEPSCWTSPSEMQNLVSSSATRCLPGKSILPFSLPVPLESWMCCAEAYSL